MCTFELNGQLGLIGLGELGGLHRQGKLGGTQLSDCMDLEEFAAVVSPWKILRAGLTSNQSSFSCFLQQLSPHFKQIQKRHIL